MHTHTHTRHTSLSPHLFLQCYLFSKRQPLPLEVEHLVTDTVEALRPDLQLFSTAQEAYEAAMELENKFRDKMGE